MPPGGATARSAVMVAVTCLAGAAAAQDTVPRLTLPPVTALVARRDLFVARAPAGPVGWMHTEVAPAADGGLLVTETIAIEDDVDLLTLSALTSRLTLRRLRQAGTVDDRPLAADLVRQGDRLRGTAIAPGGDVVTVDLPADGVLDVASLAALLPAMALAPGARGRFAVIVPGRAGPDSADVVVESAPTPPGGEAPWQVRLTVGGTVTRYAIADAAPRRVLSVQTDGRPWRFERAAPAAGPPQIPPRPAR